MIDIERKWSTYFGKKWQYGEDIDVVEVIADYKASLRKAIEKEYPDLLHAITIRELLKLIDIVEPKA